MSGPLIEVLPLWIAETNAYLIAPQGPGGECILVDAPPEPGVLIERIAQHGLKLVALLSTHGHIDHVGGVSEVVRAQPHPVPVHIHRHDRHMLEDPRGTSGSFGKMLDASISTTPPEIIEHLDDGQIVRGSGMTFRCLHTPGHTMGSVCLTLEMDGAPPILLSGDHLFAGSIGRTDLPGGSFESLMQSMSEKILPLSDEMSVLPGHGPTTTIGRERATNPFLVGLLDGDFSRDAGDGPSSNPRHWG
jgi:hydroxyacylglutathione hydrolase